MLTEWTFWLAAICVVAFVVAAAVMGNPVIWRRSDYEYDDDTVLDRARQRLQGLRRGFDGALAAHEQWQITIQPSNPSNEAERRRLRRNRRARQRRKAKKLEAQQRAALPPVVTYDHVRAIIVEADDVQSDVKEKPNAYTTDG